MSSSATFAPPFIHPDKITKDMGVLSITDGENDLSGKRYVCVKDPERTFIRGWILEEHPDGTITVQCEDETVGSSSRPSWGG